MQLLNRGLLSIRGEAKSFLQSLITNDLHRCQESSAIYSLLLNSQGRYLFDFFIYRISNDEYILDTYPSNTQELINKLTLYKMRAKVSIVDVTSQYNIYYGASDELSMIQPLLLCKDPRYAYLKFRSLSEVKISNLSNSTTYLVDKYQYSIPEGGSELGSEKALAPEWGMDHLNAISYDKGCYVGQEVVARARYQGVIRKKVYKVVAKDGAKLPNCGDIYSSSLKIGVLYSSHNDIGIALIMNEGHIEPKIEQIPIILSLAPWYQARLL